MPTNLTGLIIPIVGGSADVWGGNLNDDLLLIDSKFAATGPHRIVQTGADGLPSETGYNIDGPTATNRALYFKTAGSTRWIIDVNNTVEGIGNLGSDFSLTRFDNTGVGLDTVYPTLAADRASGKVRFGQTPQVAGPSGTFYDVIHQGNVASALGGVVEPVGTVKLYVGGFAAGDPPGGYFMLCDGRGLPISVPPVPTDQYYALYQVIGRAYTSALASPNTFQIPSTQARFVIGQSLAQPPDPSVGGTWPLTYDVTTLGKSFGIGLHTLTTQEMPQHAHPITDKQHQHGLQQSAFMAQSGGGGISGGGSSNNTALAFTGITTTENTGGNQGHDNVPPALVMQFMIRVKQ